MEKVSSKDIIIKSCTSTDIEFIVEYLSNCSEEFLRSFGADKKKIPPKEILTENFKKLLDSQGIIRTFVIVWYKNKRIGHFNVNNIIENESGIFHGQIWDTALRGLNIGLISGIMACDHFFKELNFKKIIFKVPLINGPANRAIQKLGFSSLGVVTYEFALMIEPLSCNLYEVDKNRIQELKAVKL